MNRWVILAGAGFLVLCAFIVRMALPVNPYEESARLSRAPWEQPQYAAFLKQLAEEKSAPYAFEVMRRTVFPPAANVHELSHAVGDVLYRQQGAEGMKACTSDFRSGCAHAVVIGVFLERGPAGLADITQVCAAMPGGSRAYTQCFHGLGHGALAYTHYDLSRALALCKRVGTVANKDREYIECAAGAVMELATGVHDPVAWREAAAAYFDEGDPLAPCDRSIIPEAVRSTCFLYITPHLLAAAGVDYALPADAAIARAFSACAQDPELAASDRRACYAGFGNELALMSDYRNASALPTIADATLRTVRSWCALAGDATGIAACNHAALQLFFESGLDAKGTALRYCALAGTAADACYADYALQAKQYLKGAALHARCSELPEAYQAGCAPEK